MNNLPKIRCPQFKDPWEQRKLKDLTGRTFGGGTPSTGNEEFWNGNLPWIQSSNLNENDIWYISAEKYLTAEGLNNSAAKLIPANSIAIVSRVGVGKVSVIPFEYATSQDFLSLSDLNTDIGFTAYSIQKTITGEAASQGTSIKGITKDQILNMRISCPSIEEQKEIGALLKKVDETVTLHQRFVDEYTELKKGLLQQMFV